MGHRHSSHPHKITSKCQFAVTTTIIFFLFIYTPAASVKGSNANSDKNIYVPALTGQEIDTGITPVPDEATTQTFSKEKQESTQAEPTTFRVMVTLSKAGELRRAKKLGLAAPRTGTWEYEVSPELLHKLQKLDLSLYIVGGTSRISIPVSKGQGSETTRTARVPAQETASTQTLDTGVIELRSGTINMYIADNNGYGYYYRMHNEIAPSGAIVTNLKYRLRIRDEGDGNFYCGDYEVWFFSGDVGWEQNIYDNLGGRTDGGYDDDIEDDEDIYLNWRSTSFFNGETPNQWWGIICYDNLSDDDGELQYIEFDIEWSSDPGDVGPPEIRIEPLTLSFERTASTVENITMVAEERFAVGSDRLVHLRNGIINPRLVGIETGIQKKRQMENLIADRRHVLLQFDHLLTPSERRSLRSRGINVLRYIPDFAYWAALDTAADTILTVKEGGGIRWMWHPPLSYKKSQKIIQDKFPPNAIFHDHTVLVFVQYFDDVAEEQVIRAIEDIPGATVQEAVFGKVLSVRLARSLLDTVTDLDEVEWVEPAPPPKIAYNLTAASRIHVDELWTAPYSLGGSGVAVGIWDEGRVDNHADFDSRLTVEDTSASVSSHSTHVAGTVGGSGAGNSNARGMAGQVALHSWDWNSDEAEMRSEAPPAGVVISNHSYGLISGWYWNGEYWQDYGDAYFGDYSTLAAEWDDIVVDTNLMIFKSAGNDRNDGPDYPSGPRMDGPYDCIPAYGNAKNIITVGATTDSDQLTSFSSCGPADDGRVKPDLCANGYGLTSTLPGNSYGSYSGTSMSSPCAAGAAALLFELLVNETGSTPTADTVKALLIHGCQDLGRNGPDYEYGWGLLNARKSAALIINRNWGRGTITSTGQEETFQIVVSDGASQLKGTLVWTDPAGSPSAALALVNDLDLTLEAPDASVSLPWALDGGNPENPAVRGANHVDNVEQVVVDDPIPGTWTARVKGYAVPLGAQSFTIVAEGLKSNSHEFTIYNDGEEGLTVNSISLDSPAPWIGWQPQGSFEVSPGGREVVNVSIDFDLAPLGESTRRLLIESNDDNESPYPGGVYIIVAEPSAPSISGSVLKPEVGTEGTWGEYGTGNGQFDTPQSVAASNNGYVYVADTYNHRIQRFDVLGNWQTGWGSYGSGTGEFNAPFGIAVDTNGNVYVADTFNSRIQKFDSNGTFIKEWGSFGEGNGQFHEPFAVAVDSERGYLYVTDTGIDRISRFDLNGTFLKKWGTTGSGNGQFKYAYGIAVDGEGAVYVADTNNHRIQKFNQEGNYLANWGTYGTNAGEFNKPWGICCDTMDNVYVTDKMNHRIQVFNREGEFLWKWGSSGIKEGKFNEPCDIATDPEHNTFIADTSNNRIQKFTAIVGVPGVQITLSDGGGLTTTDENGYYSHVVEYGWTGEATLGNAGYTCYPGKRSYSDPVTSDISNQDYLAIFAVKIELPLGGWTLFGNKSAFPIEWDTVRITNDIATYLVTNQEAGNWINNTVYYFDPAEQTLKSTPGDDDQLRNYRGYWIWSAVENLALLLPVTGATQNQDISVNPGWNLFSSTHDSKWSEVTLTDGVDTKSIAEAETAGWIQGTTYYFEPVSQSFRFTPGDDDYLRWYRGYYLYSNVDGITMKIE